MRPGDPASDPRLAAAVERITGVPLASLRAAAGGYTHTSNAVATLADGRSVFIKAGWDERTRTWLRAERRVYAAVRAPFMPGCVGWEDAGITALVLEDLSAATWPPPWPPGGVDVVLATLDEVHAVTAPDELPCPQEAEDLREGWQRVAGDPGGLLGSGLCSAAWLSRALPVLDGAARSAPLDGDRLVHLDVRSDNLCLRDGRCILVDWAAAARGNPLLDLAVWLPTLAREGGPPPDALAPPGMGALVAAWAGYLACRAGLPEPEGIPPPGVRGLQRTSLAQALGWAARELGLPPVA